MAMTLSLWKAAAVPDTPRISIYAFLIPRGSSDPFPFPRAYPPSIAHPTRTMAYEPMSRRRVRLQADLDSGEREQQSPIAGRLKPKIFEKGQLSVAYRIGPIDLSIMTRGNGNGGKSGYQERFRPREREMPSPYA